MPHDTREHSKTKLMAVASGGGHLIQLLRLKPLLEEYDTLYVSTLRPPGLSARAQVEIVVDANLNEKMRLARLGFQLILLLIKHRPKVIITTGAAPGFLAIVFGKILGAKTIWIDSIANSEELSTSGKKAGYWADLWLTQWPDLTGERGPEFLGAVL